MVVGYEDSDKGATVMQGFLLPSTYHTHVQLLCRHLGQKMEEWVDTNSPVKQSILYEIAHINIHYHSSNPAEVGHIVIAQGVAATHWISGVIKQRKPLCFT